MRRALLMMWLLMCVSAASSPTPAPAPAPSPPTPPATSPEAAEFATFGVALETPAGWSRMWEGRSNMIARWHNGAEGRRATAVMTLELEPANGRTLAQHAEALKRQFREGRIGIHALVMGGQPATLITGNDAEGNASRHTLVTLNDKYFYALTGYAAVPRLLPTVAIDQIARNMKFVPIADPATATELREPITYFDRFSIRLLRTMRPDPEPAPARTAYLTIGDYRTGQQALATEIQMMRNHNRLPLLALGQQFTRQMSPDAEVQWGTSQTTSPPRAITRPFTFAHPDGRTLHMRLGLVQLSEEEFIYLSFGIGAADSPESRAALEAACEKVVASVTPVAK